MDIGVGTGLGGGGMANDYTNDNDTNNGKIYRHAHNDVMWQLKDLMPQTNNNLQTYRYKTPFYHQSIFPFFKIAIEHVLIFFPLKNK